MKDSSRKKIRLAGMILMIVYVFLLIYFLFFAEWYARGPEVNVEPRYNLIPFLEIHRYIVYRDVLGTRMVFLNLFGNVIGFFPLGFLLPVVYPRLRRSWIVVYLGMTISIMVECLQLILMVGSCDVDDVILNTVGAAVGYICYLICSCLRRKMYGKKTKV